MIARILHPFRAYRLRRRLERFTLPTIGVAVCGFASVIDPRD